MKNVTQSMTLLKSLDAAGTFTAIAWKYAEPDRENDVIQPGAFTDSLAQIKQNKLSMPLLFSHDRDQPVGSITEFTDTPDALLITGKLSMTLSKAKEVYALMKDKALSISIGFMHSDEDSTVVDGLRVFSRAEIIEVSVVSVPAHSGAQILEVKSFSECASIRDFETLVRDALGLSKRQAKTLAAVGYQKLIGCDAQNETEHSQQIIKALSDATQSITKGKLS